MRPLIVDLDGTASRTDTLVESLLRLLAVQPFTLLRLLPLFFKNRARFKQNVARQMSLDPTSLAYNDAVLDLARTARSEGRQIFLVTGADHSIADTVAHHLKLFDGVFASDGNTNLTRHNKARLLVEKFGDHGYDYVGDAAADIPVWEHAHTAHAIAPRKFLLESAGRVCANVTIIGEPPNAGRLANLLRRALRVHQWTKNLLVFVPLFGAHRSDTAGLTKTFLAFVAFSLCASSVYVLNDLLDLPSDRLHPTKRRRPFAAGTLDLRAGPLLLVLCLLASLEVCLFLPAKFLFLLIGYYAATLAYSFGLKREMLVDVMLLAGLYILRLFAGGAATGTPISPWLLAFALFLFFCLAIVKRQSELVQVRNAGQEKAAGRGYRVEDLGTLASLAAASGIAAVLVLALYVNSDDVRLLYHAPETLWALCPIMLFWIARVLMLAQRGLLNDDPVIFALRDPTSQLCGLACLATVLAASL